MSEKLENKARQDIDDMRETLGEKYVVDAPNYLPKELFNTGVQNVAGLYHYVDPKGAEELSRNFPVTEDPVKRTMTVPVDILSSMGLYSLAAPVLGATASMMTPAMVRDGIAKFAVANPGVANAARWGAGFLGEQAASDVLRTGKHANSGEDYGWDDRAFNAATSGATKGVRAKSPAFDKLYSSGKMTARTAIGTAKKNLKDYLDEQSVLEKATEMFKNEMMRNAKDRAEEMID